MRPKPYQLYENDVKLVLNKYVFPSHEEFQAIDAKLHNPIHGYFPTDRRIYIGGGIVKKPKLHYRKYVPDVEQYPDGPKGICVWQHGIGAHSGGTVKLDVDGGEGETYRRYTNMGLLARMLTQHGYALYALDMLGHGLSEGIRFYIPRGKWNYNSHHLDSFARFAVSDLASNSGAGGGGGDEELPLFLMGESYGANLALHVAKQWQDAQQNSSNNVPKSFRGICIIAPAIFADLPPPAVTFFLKYCCATLFPRWTPFFMPHPVSPDRIWKNEIVRKEASQGRDTIMGFQSGGKRFRLGTAAGMLDALETVEKDVIPELEVPFAVIHGEEDAAIPIDGTEYLLEKSKTKEEDKAVKRVEDALHDLLSEESRVETVMFMIDWMNSRL